MIAYSQRYHCSYQTSFEIKETRKIREMRKIYRGEMKQIRKIYIEKMRKMEKIYI